MYNNLCLLEKAAEVSKKGLNISIEFLQQALSIAKEIENKLLHESANEAQGSVFASLGNPSKAEEHFKSSIKVFEEIRDLQKKMNGKSVFTKDMKFILLYGVLL